MSLSGVWPAVTTPFDAELKVDLPALERHVRWLFDSGCAGAVILGSLGEAPTLDLEEKGQVIATAARCAGPGHPVLVGISALSTGEAVRLARIAEQHGASGLMVLPPYVYHGDWRETRTHVAHVLGATSLPTMLYNNPVAYGTDILPAQIEELVIDHPNLVAVKESSEDLRRLTDLTLRLGDRVDLFVGIDDQVLEGVLLGARGWVAGLANALPKESVRLFELARSGKREEALALYRWFLPLLRLDTGPKFVQQIKFVQLELGVGNGLVRPPRLPLAEAEQVGIRRLVGEAMGSRPPNLLHEKDPRREPTA